MERRVSRFLTICTKLTRGTNKGLDQQEMVLHRRNSLITDNVGSGNQREGGAGVVVPLDKSVGEFGTFWAISSVCFGVSFLAV